MRRNNSRITREVKGHGEGKNRETERKTGAA